MDDLEYLATVDDVKDEVEGQFSVYSTHGSHALSGSWGGPQYLVTTPSLPQQAVAAAAVEAAAVGWSPLATQEAYPSSPQSMSVKPGDRSRELRKRRKQRRRSMSEARARRRASEGKKATGLPDRATQMALLLMETTEATQAFSSTSQFPPEPHAAAAPAAHGAPRRRRSRSVSGGRSRQEQKPTYDAIVMVDKRLRHPHASHSRRHRAASVRPQNESSELADALIRHHWVWRGDDEPPHGLWSNEGVRRSQPGARLKGTTTISKSRVNEQDFYATDSLDRRHVARDPVVGLPHNYDAEPFEPPAFVTNPRPSSRPSVRPSSRPSSRTGARTQRRDTYRPRR